MIFKRPSLSFTQMAQWIDANSYCEDVDNDKLVEYLYHLFYRRAEKCGFFTDHDKYDDFAIFCASKFLIRIANKSEAPVKSVVNYMNTVLTPWYAEYVKNYCSGSSDVEIADFNVSDFSDYLIDTVSEYDYNSYSVYCLNISSIARLYLSRIPVKKYSPEWSNICTSCLLTLHDRIKCANILCNKTLDEKSSVFLNRVIRGLRTKPPILFHVSEECAPYISVLVNEIVHAVSMELTRTLHLPVSTTSCLKNLVKAANNNEDDV